MGPIPEDSQTMQHTDPVDEQAVYISVISQYGIIKELDNDGSQSREFQCRSLRTKELLHCKLLREAKFELLKRTAARISDEDGVESTRHLAMRLIPDGSDFFRGMASDTTNTMLCCYWFHAQSFGNLHEHVRDSKGLTLAEANSYFRQIIETLVFCHCRGIIIRDLNLRKFVFADVAKSSIRLSSLDDIVLLDGSNSNGILQERHGCPAYVAPELLLPGKPLWCGRSADVYSAGVILFTMLASRYPFHDPNAVVLFRKIRNERLVVPKKAARGFVIPADVRVLIIGILRKLPNERPTAEDVLAHAWLTPRRYYGYSGVSESQENHNYHVVPRMLEDRDEPNESMDCGTELVCDQCVPDILYE